MWGWKVEVLGVVWWRRSLGGGVLVEADVCLHQLMGPGLGLLQSIVLRGEAVASQLDLGEPVLGVAQAVGQDGIQVSEESSISGLEASSTSGKLSLDSAT